MSYLPPPKSFILRMHHFLVGDPDLPPSLVDGLNNLGKNEYLIRGNITDLQYISAYVYNPGSDSLQQFYDPHVSVHYRVFCFISKIYPFDLIPLFFQPIHNPRAQAAFVDHN